MTRLRENTMRQMTPREGLQFALVRADFPLARRYAEPILDADPEDVDANFGMGMSYLMEEQYGRAEEYLKRARPQAEGAGDLEQHRRHPVPPGTPRRGESERVEGP